MLVSAAADRMLSDFITLQVRIQSGGSAEWLEADWQLCREVVHREGTEWLTDWLSWVTAAGSLLLVVVSTCVLIYLHTGWIHQWHMGGEESGYKLCRLQVLHNSPLPERRRWEGQWEGEAWGRCVAYLLVPAFCVLPPRLNVIILTSERAPTPLQTVCLWHTSLSCVQMPTLWPCRTFCAWTTTFLLELTAWSDGEFSQSVCFHAKRK